MTGTYVAEWHEVKDRRVPKVVYIIDEKRLPRIVAFPDELEYAQNMANWLNNGDMRESDIDHGVDE
jgi:hypothetical protein